MCRSWLVIAANKTAHLKIKRLYTIMKLIYCTIPITVLKVKQFVLLDKIINQMQITL